MPKNKRITLTPTDVKALTLLINYAFKGEPGPTPLKGELSHTLYRLANCAVDLARKLPAEEWPKPETK